MAFIGILGMGIVPTITDMDFQIKNQMIFVPEEKGNAMPDCENCNERCPQAEMAHEIALGRMHATNELVKLVKQIDSGKLVEVVRCKDCKYGDWDSKPDDAMVCMRTKDGFWRSGNDFCSYGERKEDDDR